MDTAEFLTREQQTIIDAAEAALVRAHSPHYESADASEVRQRLETLFDYLLDALRGRNLGPIVAYAQQVAQERFGAGYNLSEVQTAFNALEEATWGCVFTELRPQQFAEALGLVSTILGAAKDALAREYVSLATNTHAPSLDLQALFAGREGLAPPE
jgi:hypothetical protein